MLPLLLLLTPAASAQQEVCSGALAIGEWREAMGAAERALADLHGSRADRILDDVVYEIRCIDVIASPDDIGRLARLLSVVAFWHQDHEEMAYWGLLARKTLGGAPWPVDLPVPDRYFELTDAMALSEPLPEDGMGFDIPSGGGVLLDGVFVPMPAAEPEVQHLMQVVDKRGRVIYTTLMDGVRWPGGWLEEGAGPIELPEWYVAPPEPPPWSPLPPVAVVEPEDVPPEEGTPVAEEEEAPLEEEEAPLEEEEAPLEEEEAPLEETPPEETTPPPTAEQLGAELEDPSAATLGKLALLEQRRTQNTGTVTFEGDGRDPDCPWKADPRKVEASRREVVINRHSYDIRDDSGQTAYRKELRSCGEFRAARRFKRWMDAGVFSGRARYRDAMIEALLTEEPKRKGRKKR